MPLGGALSLGLPSLDQDLRVAPRAAVISSERTQQLAHTVRVCAGAGSAREPVGSVVGLLEVLDALDLDAGVLDHVAPLLLRVAPDLRRVATLLALLVL